MVLGVYPVDLRATAVSTVYMVGRGLGSTAPVVVPLVTAQVGGNLLGGMLIVGIPCALIFVLASLFLPETRGRTLSYVAGESRVAKAEP